MQQLIVEKTQGNLEVKDISGKIFTPNDGDIFILSNGDAVIVKITNGELQFVDTDGNIVDMRLISTIMSLDDQENVLAQETMQTLQSPVVEDGKLSEEEIDNVLAGTNLGENEDDSLDPAAGEESADNLEVRLYTRTAEVGNVEADILGVEDTQTDDTLAINTSISRRNQTQEVVVDDTNEDSSTQPPIDQSGSIQTPDATVPNTANLTLLGSQNINEGDSATYTIAIDRASSEDITIPINYTYISIQTGDVVNEISEVVLPAGSLSVDFSLDAINDGIYEGDESFQVGISLPSSSGSFDSLTIENQNISTIINDMQNSPVVESISSPTVSEGENLEFSITLSNPSQTQTTINLNLEHQTTTQDDIENIMYSTDGGNSWQNADVSDGEFSIIVPALNENNILVQITTVQDDIYEISESLSLSASTSTQSEAVTSVGVINDEDIDNDGILDDTPTISINAEEKVIEGENEYATFNLVKQGESSVDGGVNIALNLNTTQSEDFDGNLQFQNSEGDWQDVPNGGFINIGADTSNVALRIKIADDNLIENDENFSVAITDTQNLSVGISEVKLSIIDNLFLNDDNATVVENAEQIGGNIFANDELGEQEVSIITVSYNGKIYGINENIATPNGTLNINENGTYTYAPNSHVNHENDNEVKDIFTLHVKDENGETQTTNLTINIEDTVPTVSISEDKTQILTLEDREFKTVTSEKAVVEIDEQDFRSDGEASENARVYTLDITADGELKTADGQEITLIKDGENKIVGNYADGEAFSVEINSDGTLSVTQNTALEHKSGEDSLNLDGLIEAKVTITDSDGDTAFSNAQIGNQIIFRDDTPNVVDSSSEVVEGGEKISGDVLSEVQMGADGAKLTSFTYTNDEGEKVEGAFDAGLKTEYGTLKVQTDGTWEFTPDSSVDNTSSIDGFSYTVTDSDGDTSSATQSINITDNPDLSVSVKGKSIFEERLENGSDADSNLTSKTQQINITKGADDIKDVRFTDDAISKLDKENLTSNGEEVSYTISDDGHTITASTQSGDVFKVELQNTDDPSGQTQQYELTLLQNIDHKAVSGQSGKNEWLNFDFEVMDEDSSVQGTFGINIKDDTPEAQNDKNEVTEDTDFSTSGNLITDNDTQGADGVTISKIGDETISNKIDIKGKYGTLHVNKDGTYTYTLDNQNSEVQAQDSSDAGLSETFTYTIKDGDGDTSSASLTISIKGDNDGVNITGLSENVEHTLNEANLINGSNPDEDALSVNGRFNINANDEIKSVTIDNKEIAFSDLQNSTKIETDHGNITITGYKGDTQNGEISYTYTLTKSSDTGDYIENISVKVTDDNGDISKDSIGIKIIDDKPVAQDDQATIYEHQNIGDVASVTGNVLANDTQGADGAKVVGVRFGDDTTSDASGGVGKDIADTSNWFGKVNIDENGDFTYTIYSDNQVVQALNEGQSLTNTFTYTIQDKNGDTSTKTLDITIKGTNDGVSVTTPEQTVYENALEIIGSKSQDDTESVSSNFTITALDGLNEDEAIVITTDNGEIVLSKDEILSLSENWTKTVNTSVGTLELNGTTLITPSTSGEDNPNNYPVGTRVINYTYTLNEADDKATDDITIKVADDDTDKATSTLSINIIDDVPIPATDTVNVKEDGGVPNTVADSIGKATSIMGNVLANDTQGADGAEVIGYNKNGGDNKMYDVNEVTVQGKYGGIKITDSDGSYTYKLYDHKAVVQELNKGESDTDTFTYYIKDGDGDIKETTVTFIVTGTNDGVSVSVPSQTVYESVLEMGSNSQSDAEVVNSTFTISALDGLRENGAVVLNGGTEEISLSLSQIEDLNEIPQTLNTDEGTLVLNGYMQAENGTITIDYTYTLKHAVANNAGGYTDDITITVTDDDSGLNPDADTQTLKISIIDDKEESDQSITLNEDGTKTINTSADATRENTTFTDSAHGSVEQLENGNIVYTPKKDYSGTDSFTYEVTNDGVTESVSVLVDVKPIAENTLTQDIDDSGENELIQTKTAKYKLDKIYNDEDTSIDVKMPDFRDLLKDESEASDKGGIESVSKVTISGLPNDAIITYVDRLGEEQNATVTRGKASLTLADLKGGGDYFDYTISNFPENSNKDFTIKYTFISTDTAEISTGEMSDTQKFTVTQRVDMQGVADLDADKFSTTDQSADENVAIKLSDIIKADGLFLDTDGSETQLFVINGLPSDVVYSHGNMKNGKLTINANDLEDATITVPDEDGMYNLSITASSKENDFRQTMKTDMDLDVENDSDGQGYEEVTKTVTLTINPDAKDTRFDIRPQTISEDTSIALDIDFKSVDSNEESVTSVTISDIPKGAILHQDGVQLNIENGSITLEDYSNLTITPPKHSSSDFTLSYSANVVEEDATAITTATQKITVTPIAEVVGDDLSMNESHTFTNSASEDTAFNIGTELDKNSWINQDATSETTFAHLTFGEGSEENFSAISGAVFTYIKDGQTIMLSDYGNGVDIPSEYLESVTVTPPSNLSGNVRVQVEAKTVDYDEDGSGSNTQTSGTAFLDFDINGVADNVSLSVKQASGDEDTMIDLSVKVASSDRDGSETYSISIDDVPDDGEIYYDDKKVEISNDGTYKIEDFDSTKSLAFKPPLNSDEDYTFIINAYSSESDSTSAVQTLQLPVIVKDIADALVKNELGSQSVTDDAGGVYEYNLIKSENDLDVNDNKFLLHEVYKDGIELASYDTDGSEVQTFTVTGLDAKFDIEGGTFLGGEGESRTWSIKIDDLIANDKIYVKTPENYSGELNLNINEISTEKQGNSTSELRENVSVFITPSADGVLTNLSSSQNEDSWQELKFNFSSSDKDGSESSESLTSMTLDIPDGVSLKVDGEEITSQNGQFDITITNGIIPKIETLNAPNSDADYTIDVKYTVTDSIENITNETSKTAEYKIVVNPVTDEVTNIHLSDDSAVNISQSGENFSKTITLNSEDIDNSEEFTRVVVKNVPQGIEVEGGVYVAGGTWYIDVNNEDINEDGATYDVAFKVNGNLVNTSDAVEITIEAFAQDTNHAQDGISEEYQTGEKSVSTSFELNINHDTSGSGEAPAKIVAFNQTEQAPTCDEERSFTLGDFIEVEVNGSSKFSVKISQDDLPDGTTIEGANKIGDFWLVSGEGDTEAIQNALAEVKVYPPENFNTDDENFVYNLRLTTYGENGSYHHADIEDVSVVVTPITDVLDFDGTSNHHSTPEDTPLNIKLDLTNSTDDETTIVDGKVYLKVSNGEDMINSLEFNGKEITQSQIQNVNGLEDGNYYVLEVGENATTANVTFTPSANQDGKVSFDVFTISQEDGASSTITSHGVQNISVGEVADDISVTLNTINGNEDKLIEIDYDVVIADDSESITALTLDNIPNNYLVYFGENQALAENISGGWSIPIENDSLPKIYIKAPENVAGSIDNVTLSAVSDGGKTGVSQSVSINVEAVADEASLNPTKAFGDEYEWVDINLNASTKDLDGSETMNVTFDNLDDSAMFKLGDELISTDANSAVSVSYNDGVYTIVGIPSDKMDNLKILYHETNEQINTTLRVVDGESVSESVTGKFSLNLNSNQDIQTGDENNNIILSGDDKTVHSGDGADTIHGSDGDDTIYSEDSYDTIYGNDGDDTIYGGDGDDLIEGGKGDDTIYGGDGNEKNIKGGQGDDTIYGGEGNDYLRGDEGADSVYGEAGNDTIKIYGDDTVDGGSGDDTILFSDGIEMDFGSIKATNVENINLDNSKSDKLDNITLDDVKSVLGDESGELTLMGNKGDEVTLDATWEKVENIDGNGETSTTYSSTIDTSITLKIDDDIDVNIVH